jgi:predicted NAD/FAD-binding protein
VDHYLVPMAAAIWSSDPRMILDFPAEFLIGFFANHGLMQLRDRPQWRTIVGGSQKYISALLEPIRDSVRLRTPIKSVARSMRNVAVSLANGSREMFDEVVLATHADQTLKLLSDVTQVERDVLRGFPYQLNDAVLHTDRKLLPRRQRAWASWNYHVSPHEDQLASVTYDLGRLQRHDSPRPILLTLNATTQVDPAKIVRTFRYSHPAYSRESIVAQRRFHEISGHNRTHFCGAYWGYGFHEDGVNSALAVARHFGIGLDACTVASTRESFRTAVANR